MLVRIGVLETVEVRVGKITSTIVLVDVGEGVVDLD